MCYEALGCLGQTERRMSEQDQNVGLENNKIKLTNKDFNTKIFPNPLAIQNAYNLITTHTIPVISCPYSSI